MAELYVRYARDASTERVTDLHPLPVYMPADQPVGVSSRGFDTGLVPVPGIVSGAAYASGDAMGAWFSFPVPTEGWIDTVYGVDLDKEQLQFSLLFLNDTPTDTVADNAAMDLTDADAPKFAGHVVVSTTAYLALNDNATVTQTVGPPLHYTAPKGRLWVRCVTQGAQNFTANDDMRLGLRISL